MSPLPVTLRALSARNGLRRTLLAYTLYSLVEFAVWIALILYAYGLGGALLAAQVAVVQLLPAALLSPVLASIGDRMSRGTALALAHASVAATTALTAALLFVRVPLVVIVALSTLATIAISVVRPIHFAAMPQLARGSGELVSANALSSVIDGVMRFVGPVSAGIGVVLGGAWVVFAGASCAAFLAMLLCLKLGLPDCIGSAEPAQSSAWRDAIHGVKTLWGDWGSLALLLMMSTEFVTAGALDVLGVSFSESVLGRGQAGAGLIIGAAGLGGLLGALGSASAARRRLLAPVVLVGGTVLGFAFALVAVMTDLVPTMTIIAVAGFGSAVMIVSGRTLLQRATDDTVLARVFAVQEGTALLGLAIGAALAPILIDLLSPAGAFAPIGCGVVVITVAGVALVRRLDARAVYLPEELALLGGVRLFAGLPPDELERLAQRATWIDVVAGSVVVRQGDSGNEYFVVSHGEFVATVDGVQRPNMLVSGEGFGEIALLRAVARTATITAVAAGRLLMLRSEDFLAAVTGSADGAVVAAETEAAHRARDRALER